MADQNAKESSETEGDHNRLESGLTNEQLEAALSILDRAEEADAREEPDVERPRPFARAVAALRPPTG